MRTKNNNRLRFTGAVALLISLLSSPRIAPASAQVQMGPPVRLKTRIEKPKQDSFPGEVVNFTPSSITVRNRSNFALIRTFSYSPQLARKLENRHMEPGDRVTVRYLRGTDTAVGLKGKIRKAEPPYLPRVR